MCGISFDLFYLKYELFRLTANDLTSAFYQLVVLCIDGSVIQSYVLSFCTPQDVIKFLIVSRNFLKYLERTH
jgi:hypothetical protein